MENVMRTKPMSVINAEEVAEELPRHLSLFDLLCIGIGSTVGSGVFSTSGEIISTTAGPAAFVSWIIAGLVCCINALAYMELVTCIPSSGSTYAYAYHAMGELPAVVAAWLLTLEYGVSGSGVARSWATKVQDWLEEEHPEYSYQWLNEDYTNLLGAVMMALCVGVLLVGVRFGKWFVNTITTIKVFVVLFIIVVGFSFMNTDNLSPFVPERQDVDGSMAFGAQGIITGASSAFFGYTGFDEVCCLAAEAKNPKKIMPLAVIGVVTGTMFLSAFASLALSGMIPYQQAESFGSGFDYQNANWAAQIVRAGETCTMPVVVLVCFLAQPRLNYALSCDGLMPRIFSKVDDKGNLFENTLITGTFFTAVAFVIPFETLWDIVSFGVLLSFNMSMSSLLVMRMHKKSPVLASKLISLMVISAGLAAFFYQIGYSNEGHVWCLVVGIIFLVVTIIACFAMYFKCPQELSNPDNFAAPFVPFLPTFAVLANFYLAAQISYTGIYTSFAWLVASVVFYFSYGYKHSAGRTEKVMSKATSVAYAIDKHLFKQEITHPDTKITMEREPTFMENILRTKPLRVIHAEEQVEELPRQMSLFDLICIGISASVGSGIFSTTGEIISSTAGPAAFVSWIIAGIVCCINALAYMEMVTRVPSSGSTYAYSFYALGELPAVVAAWLVSLEYGVSGSGVARSWATKVQDWLEEEHPGHSYQWLNEDYYNLLGSVMMALCVGVLLMGVRFSKWFINIFTIVKVLVVLFIIIAGFAYTDMDNFSPFVPVRQDVDGTMAFGTQGIITGASSAFFGYVGFDEVCCLAAEAKNPKKIMPLAVIGVVLGIMFLSSFASLALSGLIPYLQADSFGAGFEYQGQRWASQIVRAGETCTMPVVVLVSFLAQPRLNYALACDGLMPRIFAKVDEKGNLFVNTLITGVVFTVVALFIPFDTLWDIVSFGILLSFNMTNSSLLMVRMRKASPSLAPKLIGLMVGSAWFAAFFYQIGYSNEGYVWCLVLGIVFLVVTVIACFAMYFKCPQEETLPENFASPFVPFLPTLAVLANFYLAAQINYTGIYASCAWLAASVVFYFSYGYKHSAGRTGWSSLMSLPRESTMLSPIISDKKQLQE
ncbi:hypothetical protein BBJ29_005210 [Phytophthora kernoviae]|uniref:Cationic amino acid transporter C-terminal domain-containing protein n=1 Tax=Phytophthora kernoviae TaxID=325452 RepID=A0A3R7JGR8_9STRA|nr:hypothetical protein BBJ29_005210 [Phytophthora kernoviae]